MQYKPCACCGENTLEVKSKHDICPVCGWEDDTVQNKDPDYRGGANFINLNEAKKAWAEGKHLRAVKKEAKTLYRQQHSKETASAEQVVQAFEPDLSLAESVI